MRHGFGRLPFLGRLSARAERSPSSEAAAVRAPIDPDLAPLGPPVLLPRAIIRQVLFDGLQLVPIWAMPRAESAPATTPNETKATKATKRPRRPKATGTSAAKLANETSAAKPATAAPRSRTRKRDV
jgi:hypothetical protein